MLDCGYNDLITIVIPIYNVESYLKKCIDSVLQQTYRNLEIILVNDGSTDGCPEICDEYKKVDKRIIVIHKKNGGLSDARNAGIQNSHGKYILFVDSDDFIKKECVEILYKNIKEYNKDISIGQIEQFSIYEEVKEKNIKQIIWQYNKIEAMEQLLYNTRYTSSTAGKLFLTDLFKEIRFPFGKKYEDLATVYKIIYASNGVVVTNKEVYNYFIARTESIMHEKFSETRMDALYFTEEILWFIKKAIPKIEIAAVTRLLIEARDIFVEIPNNGVYEQQENYVYNYIKKYRTKVVFNPKLPIKRKIAILPVLFGKKMIRFAWKLKLRLKRKRVV